MRKQCGRDFTVLSMLTYQPSVSMKSVHMQMLWRMLAVLSCVCITLLGQV